MMEKKNPKANVNLLKPRFFLMGLVASLSLSLVAFEWRTPLTQEEVNKTWDRTSIIETEDIPVTVVERPKLPEPKIEKTVSRALPPVVAPIIQVVKSTDPEPEPIDITIDFSIDQFDDPEPDPRVDLFVPVEHMPEFPGGEKALFKFLGEHIHYPSICRDNGIQGKVFVQFIVAEDGSISNIEIAAGANYYLDEEAKRVIALMPKWIPGKQRNRPVKVGMRLPVTFKLKG